MGGGWGGGKRGFGGNNLSKENVCLRGAMLCGWRNKVIKRVGEADDSSGQLTSTKPFPTKRRG